MTTASSPKALHNATPTADQLLASPLPDKTQYVVDRMIQANNPRPSMLVGLPRGGKSTLATQIAVAVANGTDTLERQTQKGHVIFWKTEDSMPQTHASFRKAGLIPGVSELSFIFPKLLPPGTDKVQVLVEQLAKYPDTKLVVIETLASYMGDVALNESKDIIRAFEKFNSDIMIHYPKPAYLFIHQFNKNSKGNDTAPVRAMSRINGSVFLSAETACTIYLDQVSDEDKRRTIMTEGREGDVEIAPTFLIFDAATNTSTLGGTVADERAAKAKEKQDKEVCNADAMIEASLLKHPNIGKKDLYAVLRKAGLKMGADAMRLAVQSNIDLGWITVTKDGKYERLTWSGIPGLSPDPESPPESVAVDVSDAGPAGSITEDPSWSTSFKVSSHICKALTLSSPEHTQPWDVISQNLLTKGHAAVYIMAVFDAFRAEDKKNDVTMRTTPGIFEKEFNQIATRMTERMVAQ